MKRQDLRRYAFLITFGRSLSFDTPEEALNNYLETNGYYLLFNTFNLSICLIGVILIVDVMLIRKEKICNDFFIKHTLFLDEGEGDE